MNSKDYMKKSKERLENSKREKSLSDSKGNNTREFKGSSKKLKSSKGNVEKRRIGFEC